MPTTTIIMIISVILFLLAGFLYFRQSYSLYKRAKKIDPTVKTMAEANFVLNKAIAQSIGSDAANSNKQDQDNNESNTQAQ